MPSPRTLPVCAKDLENLRASGLTDATIRAAKLRTEKGALWFPYRDLDGNVNCFARWRPHKPRVCDGRLAKYEQPKGSPLRAYLPPASLEKLRDGNSPAYVTEGEKKALALAQLGDAAVGITGIWCGCKKGQQELIDDLAAIPWAGRTVYIVFDYDPKPKTRQDATAARRCLARALRKVGVKEILVVELPPGPKNAKQGVDDFLVARRKDDPDAFARLVARARPEGENATARSLDSSTPRSLDKPAAKTTAPKSAVESFPLDALPEKLRGFVKSVAKALPCPVDFPGVMVLPVLGAFIGRKRCVEVKANWREYPQLWAAIVARSGDRKTPAFKEATEPLRRKLTETRREWLREMKEWNDTPKEEREGRKSPRLRQTHTTDCTIEALKDVLDGNPNGVCYIADELSGWVRSMGQYKGGRGDDRQHWLSIWSGVQLVSNRKSQSGPIVIDDPFVGMVGGIQPDCLGDVIRDGREDGGAARVLFAYPDPLAKTDWTEDGVSGGCDYAACCERLWNLSEKTEALKLSPDAKAAWVEWVNGHRREKPSNYLKPFWSKCEGYSLRLALTLCLADDATAKAVTKKSVKGALKLIAYFKSHARRVYKVAADNADDTRVGRALRWIKERGGSVTATQVNQHKVCGVGDAEEAKQLLNDLQSLGHGQTQSAPRNSVVFCLREF